jgi:hypothetical protein
MGGTIQMRNCKVAWHMFGGDEKMKEDEGESESGTVHEKAKLALKTESQRCKSARRCASLFQSSNEIGRGSTAVYPAKPVVNTRL